MAKKEFRQKTVKGFYYQVCLTTPDESEKPLNEDTLNSLFQTVSSISIEDRKKSVSGMDRLLVFSSDKVNGLNIPVIDGYFTGSFMSYKAGFTPLLAEESNGSFSIEPLSMEDNQSLIDITYFMIHKKKGILLLMNNRLAGSSEIIEGYITTLISTDEKFKEFKEINKVTSINIVALIEKERMQRLANMIAVKKFELTFKVLPASDQFEATSFAEESIIRFANNEMKDLECSSVKIEFAAGKGESLEKNVIQKEVNKILRKRPEEPGATRAKVIGINQYSSPTEINFIKDDFMFATTLSIPKNKKWPNLDLLFSAMNTDFIQRITELEQRLKLK